jgi:hypothetical protein
MSTAEQERLSTIERIERALVVLAYFIELDGDVHVPMPVRIWPTLDSARFRDECAVRFCKCLMGLARHGR